jgi:hypothetical protein
MYFQRVAVNNAGLSDKIIGQRNARQKGEHRYDRDSTHALDLAATANCAD